MTNLEGASKPLCKMKGQLSPDREEDMRREVYKPIELEGVHSRWEVSLEVPRGPQHDPIHPR